MNDHIPAWQKFSEPIGIALAWIMGISFGILLIVGFVRLVSMNDNEKAFNAECARRSAVVDKFNGQHMCYTSELIPEVIPPDYSSFKGACNGAGGVPQTIRGSYACYEVTIDSALGARRDYRRP